jgi:hypothetical protein
MSIVVFGVKDRGGMSLRCVSNHLQDYPMRR